MLRAPNKRCLALAAAALAAWSPAARAADSPRAGTVSITAKSVTTADGTVVPYEAGVLHVSENRAAPTSRVIAIGFARFKSRRPGQAPPIIMLPGGPGSSLADALTGTDDNARRRVAMFVAYSAVADVVVFDQRGFSKTGTTLAVPPAPPMPLDRPSSVRASTEQWRAVAKGIAAANRNHDLAGYNVVQCAADVNDLRKALGYQTISLVGGSFGSQWSFAIMRLYPDIVARAVLSGVEPLDNGFDMPSHVFAALARIAHDADRAPGLQPYLPPGGLIAAVRELRERFARGPITVRPAGKPESVVLGLEDFQAALAGADAADWPAFVLSLYHRHYDDWARDEIASRQKPPFRSAINPLIDSGLGVSAARDHLLQSDPATHYLGTWNFAPHQGSRPAWPTPDLGDALRAPAIQQTPVVFISGDWDTSTPIENMLGIAPYFPRGRTIVVRREEHAPPHRMTRKHPAVFAALLEFLRTGATADLPVEFTVTPDPFTTPRFPPPARR